MPKQTAPKQDAAPKERKEQAPRDVQYATEAGFGFVDEIPAHSVARSSPLMTEVQACVAAVEASPDQFTGKPYLIASYKNDAAAGSAAKDLRRRMPDGDFKFTTAWLGRADDKENRRRGLFVQYDPSKPYGKQAHDARKAIAPTADAAPQETATATPPGFETEGGGEQAAQAS